MSRSGAATAPRLQGVERREEADGQERLRLLTSDGVMDARLQHAAEGEVAVLWLFGVGGGLNGPAEGLYTRIGRQLRPHGILSLELAYRHPGQLEHCVQDVLLGLRWLAGEGRRRVILVGHSFGGAVVIAAGAASNAVVAIAALSSQTRGTEAAYLLSPRPLVLIHGTTDEVLPEICSRDIHQRAREPKELILYPGCGHGLDECRDALDRDLLAWLTKVA